MPKRGATDEEILKATFALLAEEGLAQLRMSDVSDRVGCARATLYRRFATREALLVALIEREAERILASIVEVASRPATLEERLTEAVSRAVELVRDAEHLRPFFVPEAVGLTKDLATRASALLPRSVSTFEALLRGAEGSLASDLNPLEVGEWLTRNILSLLSFPIKLSNSEHLRAFVRRYVIHPLIE